MYDVTTIEDLYTKYPILRTPSQETINHIENHSTLKQMLFLLHSYKFIFTINTGISDSLYSVRIRRKGTMKKDIKITPMTEDEFNEFVDKNSYDINRVYYRWFTIEEVEIMSIPVGDSEHWIPVLMKINKRDFGEDNNTY